MTNLVNKKRLLYINLKYNFTYSMQSVETKKKKNSGSVSKLALNNELKRDILI
jgi:hypothetical protein